MFLRKKMLPPLCLPSDPVAGDHVVYEGLLKDIPHQRKGAD